MTESSTGTQVTPSDEAPRNAAPRVEAMVFVGLCVAISVFVIVQTTTIRTPPIAENTLGPSVIPLVVGCMMLVTALVVLVQQLRGKFAAPEEGEDVDVHASTSWPTVGLIVLSFASLIVTIDWLGWPIAVAILFFGASTALGARRWWVTIVSSIAIGVLTQLLFGTLLGLSLPVTGTLTSWIPL